MTAALILSTSAALATTVYATVNCRFVVITFTSDTGDLEQYFSAGSNRGGNAGNSTTYKAAVGLYQWLSPTDPSNNWSIGSCVGYEQTMLDVIGGDKNFEVSRTFAVFAVLTGIMLVGWSYLMACLDMNNIQVYLLLGMAFIGMLSTALTFLFHQSALCQTEFLTHECKIDQGGLVMIAAVFFWLVTFVIAVTFVLPTVRAAYRDGAIVSFDREDAHDEAKLAGDKERGRGVNKAYQKEASLESYSFDSQESWTRPVPKRSAASLQKQLQNKQLSSKQQRAASAIQQYPPRQEDINAAVVPLSHKMSTEVYVAKRLDRIEQLTDA